MRIWLATVIGSALSVAALWWTLIPLGIHGEWIWERSVSEADLVWNLCGGIVATAIVVAFVVQGWRRLDDSENGRRTGTEVAAWLIGLTAISFGNCGLFRNCHPSNAAWERRHSFCITAVRLATSHELSITPMIGELLAGYEDLMREGDVLHTGTHPPGLFLVFHGLVSILRIVNAVVRGA